MDGGGWRSSAIGLQGPGTESGPSPAGSEPTPRSPARGGPRLRRRRRDPHLPTLTGCEAGLLRELGKERESVIGGTGPEDRGHAHDRHARSLQLGKTGEELVDAPRRSPGRDADPDGVAVAPLG